MKSGSLRGLTAGFLSGALFGAGLLVSGMVRPEKVVGFLDVFGVWDPSLMLVMVGAIGVHAILLRLIRRRARPLFEPSFFEPAKRHVDGPLVAGAALFGVGWGLGGYCPGPALAAVGAGNGKAVLFVAAMLVGMAGQHAFAAFSSRSEGKRDAQSGNGVPTPLDV
jgi:uncharacterized membrane protein YedE/YeeE